MKKELKLILREYGIKQEDMFNKFGWTFNEVTKELLDDLKRQLGVTEYEMEKIKREMNK